MAMRVFADIDLQPPADATAFVRSVDIASCSSYANSPDKQLNNSKFDANLTFLPTGPAAMASSAAPHRKPKSVNSTSRFKGVTKHRSTGKFEAHLWDSSHVRMSKVSSISQCVFAIFSSRPHMSGQPWAVMTCENCCTSELSLHIPETRRPHTRQADISWRIWFRAGCSMCV